MSVLSAIQSGNFSSAATWNVVYSASFTSSLLQQEYGTLGTTTTFNTTTSVLILSSPLVCSGVLIKPSIKTSGGTITIRIYNVTLSAAVAGTTVTFDTALLTGNNATTTATACPQWVFIKFPSPVTLPANSVRIEFLGSATNNAYLYRKSSGGISYGLVTTATAIPAAGDQLLVSPIISNNAVSGVTITHDNEATTQFGTATSGNSALEVSYLCNYQLSTASNKNIYFRIAGNITLNEGSSFICGSSNFNRIPITSTATIEFIMTTNGQYGLTQRNSTTGISLESKFIVFGDNSRGNGIDFLANTVSAGATSVSTISPTNWKSGDFIVIPPTSRTITQAENRTLSANASGTVLTLSSALTYAHTNNVENSLNTPILNFTKNVKFLGTSVSLNGFLKFGNQCNLNCNQAEFTYIGSPNAISADSTGLTYPFNIDSCSFKQAELTGTSSGISITIDQYATASTTIFNCIFYRISLNALNITDNSMSSAYVAATTIYCIGSGSTTNHKTNIAINSYKGDFYDLYCAGIGSSAIEYTYPSAFVSDYYLAFPRQFINWMAHSCYSGINITAPMLQSGNGNTSITFSNLFGCLSSSSTSGSGCFVQANNIKIKDSKFNSNIKQNLRLLNSNNIVISNSFLNDDNITPYNSNTVVSFDNVTNIKFVDTYFSANQIVKSDNPGTIQNIDISFVRSGNSDSSRNTVIDSTSSYYLTDNSKISFSTGLLDPYIYPSADSNPISYKSGGFIQRETSIFYESSPSLKLCQNPLIGRPLTSEIKWVPVPSGKRVVVNLYVRRDTNITQFPKLIQVPPLDQTGTIYDVTEAIIIIDNTYSLPLNTWVKITGQTEISSSDAVFGFFLSLPVQSAIGNFFIGKWEVSYA